jgi:hypothetical protein
MNDIKDFNASDNSCRWKVCCSRKILGFVVSTFLSSAWLKSWFWNYSYEAESILFIDCTTWDWHQCDCIIDYFWSLFLVMFIIVLRIARVPGLVKRWQQWLPGINRSGGLDDWSNLQNRYPRSSSSLWEHLIRHSGSITVPARLLMNDSIIREGVRMNSSSRQS